jgi:glycosyltransferase involved in cell wall biosynthesis
MDACFVPFDDVNPYQTLLATELERLGVSVRTDVRGDDLVGGRDLPQIIHLHWLRSMALRPSILAPCLRSLRNLRQLRSEKRRLIWTAHNLIPHDSKYPVLQRWYSRQIGKLCSAVIAHSPTAKRELLEKLGSFLDARVSVIPHGHYIDRYPNTVSAQQAREWLRFPMDASILLFLGVLRPYKGLEELVREWKSLQPANAYLMIAGRPVTESVGADLSRIAEGAEDIRIFKEHVPEFQIQHFMNAADAVVFPYRRVLTSGALVLAMSFGKPCIAPRTGSIVDYIADSGGYLYDADEQDGLRRALQAVLAGPGTLREMGRRNRARVAQWDWASIARATHHLYRGEAPTAFAGSWG